MTIKPRKFAAKVGSMPRVIILRGGTKPTVGRKITFRRAVVGYGWETGVVTKFNADGHIFIALDDSTNDFLS